MKKKKRQTAAAKRRLQHYSLLLLVSGVLVMIPSVTAIPPVIGYAVFAIIMSVLLWHTNRQLGHGSVAIKAVSAVLGFSAVVILINTLIPALPIVGVPLFTMMAVTVVPYTALYIVSLLIQDSGNQPSKADLLEVAVAFVAATFAAMIYHSDVSTQLLSALEVEEITMLASAALLVFNGMVAGQVAKSDHRDDGSILKRVYLAIASLLVLGTIGSMVGVIPPEIILYLWVNAQGSGIILIAVLLITLMLINTTAIDARERRELAEQTSTIDDKDDPDLQRLTDFGDETGDSYPSHEEQLRHSRLHNR